MEHQGAGAVAAGDHANRPVADGAQEGVDLDPVGDRLVGRVAKLDGHGAEGGGLHQGVHADIHQGAGEHGAQRLPAGAPMVLGLLGDEAGLQLGLQRRPVHVGVEALPIAVTDRHQEGVDVARGLEFRHRGAGAERQGQEEGGGEIAEQAHVQTLYSGSDD